MTKEQMRIYRDDIVKFAEDLYYLGPVKRIKLWDYQKEVLREVTAKDEEGKYKYPISIISLPRQNGKSELASIISLHALFFGSSYGHQILSVAIGGRDVARVIL